MMAALNPRDLYGGTASFEEGHESPFAVKHEGSFYHVRMRLLGGEWVPVFGPARPSAD